MIVVDTSAIVAVLQGEPEKGAFKTVVENDDRAVVSAVSALEAGIVMRARHGEDGLKGLFDFFTAADIQVAVFDEDQAKARRSLRTIWKGLEPCYPPQSWRLCRLRARQDPQRTLALQGWRLRRNRHSISPLGANTLPEGSARVSSAPGS